MLVAHCHGKEGNSSQQADDGIEEGEDAGNHSGSADYEGAVDQLQGADRQNESAKIQFVLVVEYGQMGKLLPDVFLKRVHYRLPAYPDWGTQVSSART